MCGMQTSGGGGETGQFGTQKECVREEEKAKEKVTAKDRGRQKDAADRDGATLTVGCEQGSHSHSCHRPE